MMLGSAIWLTVKFILYVNPFASFYEYDTDPSAAVMSAIGKPTHIHSHPSVGGGGDKIQSLRVWEPPSFCMAFFWYVPHNIPSSVHFTNPSSQYLCTQSPPLSLSTPLHLLLLTESVFIQLAPLADNQCPTAHSPPLNIHPHPLSSPPNPSPAFINHNPTIPPLDHLRSIGQRSFVPQCRGNEGI